MNIVSTVKSVRNWVGQSMLNVPLARTSPAAVTWNKLIWIEELGLFVGSSGTASTSTNIMTSPDGVTWSLRTTPNTNAVQGLCYSKKLNLIVAVCSSGTGNRVTTSPDGINWTARTTPSDQSWYDVCWSEKLGLFCAISAGAVVNNIMTSPDGINWTLQTKANTNMLYAIAWSPQLNLFAAGTTLTGAVNCVFTSPDGINWTLRTTPLVNIQAMCWSDDLGMFFAATLNLGVLKSNNGVNWSLVALAGSYDCKSILWCAELSLLIIGNNTSSTPMLIFSRDGIKFLNATVTTTRTVGIAWSPQLSKLVVVGNNLIANAPR